MGKISKEDKDLFREAMGDVKPLKPHGKVETKQTPKPFKRKTDNSFESETTSQLDEDRSTEEVGPETPLFYAQSGVNPKFLKQLKRGDIAVDSLLDMHGMTVAEAEIALIDAINEAKEHGARVLQIIHGKGRTPNQAPVLKNKVNRWLRAHAEVIAFCSAPRQLGGAGSVFILLKR